MDLRDQLELPAYRERCYVCFRPVASCFCEVIPSIANKTHVLILQHVKERFHPFNTARIVRQALQNCTLIVDRTLNLASRDLPFHQNTGLLFPGDDSKLLTDLPQSGRPEQLVILDGTWHHAKTFMQQIPVLQRLPKFRLEPETPSNYRIREEPTATALSTLEATVAALRSLEPDTEGLELLLRAFDTMVDNQIHFPHQVKQLRLRKRAPRPPANIPSAIISDLSNVVVAYGEAAQHEDGIRQKHRKPIYWVAQRLGTGESFELAIQPDWKLTSEFQMHLELNEADFSEAASVDAFRSAWQNFLKPTDTLAVYKESTLRLLATIDAEFVPSVTMKCINLQNGARTLESTLEQLGLQPCQGTQKGRAGRRLANAVCFVRYLNVLGNSYVSGG